ncbi:unnamed protein product [Protopolystoma xenopodis]|uniref:Uncharacterized protein n=1 Tax=Protopolystoma xenopodis TaxID=117903 RepID=A0A448WCD1_9PLAT|nr:unnamed protein product [Protopolystoma xenopodis]
MLSACNPITLATSVLPGLLPAISASASGNQPNILNATMTVSSAAPTISSAPSASSSIHSTTSVTMPPPPASFILPSGPAGGNGHLRHQHQPRPHQSNSKTGIDLSATPSSFPSRESVTEPLSSTLISHLPSQASSSSLVDAVVSTAFLTSSGSGSTLSRRRCPPLPDTTAITTVSSASIGPSSKSAPFTFITSNSGFEGYMPTANSVPGALTSTNIAILDSKTALPFITTSVSTTSITTYTSSNTSLGLPTSGSGNVFSSSGPAKTRVGLFRSGVSSIHRPDGLSGRTAVISGPVFGSLVSSGRAPHLTSSNSRANTGPSPTSNSNGGSSSHHLEIGL